MLILGQADAIHPLLTILHQLSAHSLHEILPGSTLEQRRHTQEDVFAALRLAYASSGVLVNKGVEPNSRSGFVSHLRSGLPVR
jgi:hypothetical protein